MRKQESTLEAGRERDDALQQLEQERAQLQAVAQSQARMAQQLDALGQELAATRQQLQQSQASSCSLAVAGISQLVMMIWEPLPTRLGVCRRHLCSFCWKPWDRG